MNICRSTAKAPTSSSSSVSGRYERGSIIITSNQSLGACGEVFEDAVIASAILDRLLHNSITIDIKGERFRLKEQLKAGLLKPKLDEQPVTSSTVVVFHTEPRGGRPLALRPEANSAVARRIREAHLPRMKTLDEFDFA